MAKPSIHPVTKDVKYTMSKGSLSIPSTFHGDSFLLDIDIFNSAAWADDQSKYINERAGNIAKFHKKFGGIGSSTLKSQEAPKDSPAEESKDSKES